MTPRTPRIKINQSRQEVHVAGKPVHLAKKEYLILVALTESGNTMTRAQLLDEVWGAEYADLDSRTVDQHLSRLRKKIGTGLISTIAGFGYRWDGAAVA